MIYLKQYFDWPCRAAGLDVTKYRNEITILYDGGSRNIYFKTKRTGGNDEQNKLDKGLGLRMLQFYDSSRLFMPFGGFKVPG